MTTLPSIGLRLDYTVQTFDIDRRRRMTLAALVRQMQEAAMQNVMGLKVSVWDMEAEHLSWVLLRKNLNVERLPLVGEKLSIVTYPAGFEKVFTYRDFKVYDENEKLIATSSTTWLLLDTQTRRMTRIPDFVLAFAPQIPPPEDCLPRAKTNVPKLERVDASLPFRTNFHDLDFNGHLNNVFYIQWMLETLPDEVLENGHFRSLDIQYKVESHWKDEVLAERQDLDGGKFATRLVRQSDGKELAVGVFRGNWGTGELT